MEEQETTYGKKLIAEFMELQLIEGVNENGSKYYYYNNPIMEDFEAIPSYDSDWNDLMPVREKIESLGFVCLFYSNICFIQDINSFTKKIGVPKFYVENYGTLLNECVFRSIVLFIEWYNIHKPEQP